MSQQATPLPEVTEAHRRAAFEAMHWEGWTFERAMNDDSRRRLVEARAHQVRTREACGRAWMPTPSLQANRPVCAAPAVRNTPLLRPLPAGAVDRKRAAAGDRDEE